MSWNSITKPGSWNNRSLPKLGMYQHSPKSTEPGMGVPRKTYGSTSKKLQVCMIRVRNTREGRQETHTRYKQMYCVIWYKCWQKSLELRASCDWFVNVNVFLQSGFLEGADCEIASGCSVAPKTCEEKLHNPVQNSVLQTHRNSDNILLL